MGVWSPRRSLPAFALGAARRSYGEGYEMTRRGHRANRRDDAVSFALLRLRIHRIAFRAEMTRVSRSVSPSRHLVAFAIRRNAQRFRAKAGRDLRGDHTPIPLTITERYRRAYGGAVQKGEKWTVSPEGPSGPFLAPSERAGGRTRTNVQT